MSMDFNTLKTLSIPQGVVQKISDANGVVLWESPCTITVSGNGNHVVQGVKFSYGNDYNGCWGNTDGTSITFTAKKGDFITFELITYTSTSAYSIVLNGVTVCTCSGANESATYTYEVVSDATITLASGSDGYPRITYITDANA